MTCSPARLAANRQNALKSTGPRSAAGKAASRLNAFQHGMAGAGDLVGPGEDQALVARRAGAFARELGASGEVGSLLAHRAALLSVRMERVSDRELVAVAVGSAMAQAQFDQDRIDRVAELVATLAAGGDDVGSAISELADSPAGVTALIDAWGSLLGELTAPDPDPDRAGLATGRALVWLGAGAGSSAGLTGRVTAELARLRRLADSMGNRADQIDQAREQAGLLASFDPSSEAHQARRYEAAAERGMYRAIRAIADLNRNRAGDPTTLADDVAASLATTHAHLASSGPRPAPVHLPHLPHRRHRFRPEPRPRPPTRWVRSAPGSGLT